jgi:hypothetical protein
MIKQNFCAVGFKRRSATRVRVTTQKLYESVKFLGIGRDSDHHPELMNLLNEKNLNDLLVPAILQQLKLTNSNDLTKVIIRPK